MDWTAKGLSQREHDDEAEAPGSTGQSPPLPRAAAGEQHTSQHHDARERQRQSAPQQEAAPLDYLSGRGSGLEPKQLEWARAAVDTLLGCSLVLAMHPDQVGSKAAAVGV